MHTNQAVSERQAQVITRVINTQLDVVPTALDDFSHKIDNCIQSLQHSLKGLDECYYSIQCDDTRFLQLRGQLYGEASMYSRVILPRTIHFVEGLTQILEIFSFIDDDEVYTATLPAQAENFKSAKQEAMLLRRKHTFVLANLSRLKREAITQEKLYIQDSHAARNSGASARGGAGALGGAAIVLGAGAMVFPPLALLGVLFMGAAAGLGETSKARVHKAEYLEAASLSTKAVLESLGGFTRIVEVGEILLTKLGSELGGIAKLAGAEEAKRKAYIRVVKPKIAKALEMCERFLDCQPVFEKTLGAIADSTMPEFVAGWKRQLQDFEMSYSE